MRNAERGGNFLWQTNAILSSQSFAGCMMALVTTVKLELDTDIRAVELLCTAVTLATSDCKNQILTKLVRLDIVEIFDRMLYAPITAADSEHLIGQLHPAFASALAAALESDLGPTHAT